MFLRKNAKIKIQYTFLAFFFQQAIISNGIARKEHLLVLYAADRKTVAGATARAATECATAVDAQDAA